MSITDELREYVRHYSVAGSSKDKTLTAIADRIDAEHESACAEAYGNGVMSAPIALDESAWVKLPVDADGVPIHVGDELDGYGKTIEVVELRHGRSGWVLISRDGNAYHDTFAFSHHHAPTVEDVLREFAEKITDSQIPNVHPTYEEAIAEYAAKLRLASNEEYCPSCGAEVVE